MKRCWREEEQLSLLLRKVLAIAVHYIRLGSLFILLILSLLFFPEGNSLSQRSTMIAV